MTVREIAACPEFTIVNEGSTMDTDITRLFTCDLLSICMSKASASCAWVTVMGNVNAVAVAVLTDAACIVLAENISLDEAALAKAEQQQVTVLKTALPIFDAALLIHSKLPCAG